MKTTYFIDKIPHKYSNIQSHKFNKDFYLLENPLCGISLRVTPSVIKILQQVDGKKNLLEICKSINLETSSENIQFLYKLLFQELSSYAIITNIDNQPLKKRKTSYLKLRFTFIHFNIANYIGVKTSILFNRKGFLASFTLIVVAHTLLLFNLPYHIFANESINLSSDINIYIITPLILMVVLSHEFGHISALNYWGEQSKGIGFGFYLFTPVFFADVTTAWRLSNKQRLVVDIGGIYFQLLMTGFLSLIYLLSGETNVLFVIALSTTSILYNLIPFFRTDGYWLLSDAINVSNLREVSMSKLKNLFKKLFRIRKDTIIRNDFLLAMYASISLSLIIVFIAYMLFWNTNSVLLFPIKLYEFITQAFSGNKEVWLLNNLINISLYLIFYVLLFKHVFSFIENKNSIKNIVKKVTLFKNTFGNSRV